MLRGAMLDTARRCFNAPDGGQAPAARRRARHALVPRPHHRMRMADARRGIHGPVSVYVRRSVPGRRAPVAPRAPPGALTPPLMERARVHARRISTRRERERDEADERRRRENGDARSGGRNASSRRRRRRRRPFNNVRHLFNTRSTPRPCGTRTGYARSLARRRRNSRAPRTTSRWRCSIPLGPLRGPPARHPPAPSSPNRRGVSSPGCTSRRSYARGHHYQVTKRVAGVRRVRRPRRTRGPTGGTACWALFSPRG